MQRVVIVGAGQGGRRAAECHVKAGVAGELVNRGGVVHQP